MIAHIGLYSEKLRTIKPPLFGFLSIFFLLGRFGLASAGKGEADFLLKDD
jgi:hypothetical protein